MCIYIYNIRHIKFHELLGFCDFLGNIGYQGQDAIFGAEYAHKGRTKKLFLPSEGAISDCFQPFPLGHLWTPEGANHDA